MQSLEDLDLAHKRVLVRVDFNVPLDGEGRVTSDARIEAALPTIEYLLSHGGRPILMSHLGRPGGRIVPELRMLPVAERYQELSGHAVRSAPDCVGGLVQDLALGLQEDEVLVLENLRFHAGETRGDEGFGKELAALGELYVNDAFGSCHRAHASVSVVPRLLPGAAGRLLAQELGAFQRILEHPERPLVAVLGGAKVSDKLPVIENLLPRVDRILVGGAMAYTFLLAQGIQVGKSLVEPELLQRARAILSQAEDSAETELLLPVDHLAARGMEEGSPYEITSPGVPDPLIGLDIGPQTRKLYREKIVDAKSLVWNGPMGLFEVVTFRRGTEDVAEAVARCEGFTVAGGGDSVAALELLGLTERIDHVSTGGGASLELLEGKTLPGVAALG
ncbi:MAG: phosphoglycerate kinase [Planctomycetota bacterium]